MINYVVMVFSFSHNLVRGLYIVADHFRSINKSSSVMGCYLIIENLRWFRSLISNGFCSL